MKTCAAMIARDPPPGTAAPEGVALASVGLLYRMCM